MRVKTQIVLIAIGVLLFCSFVSHILETMQ